MLKCKQGIHNKNLIVIATTLPNDSKSYKRKKNLTNNFNKYGVDVVFNEGIYNLHSTHIQYKILLDRFLAFKQSTYEFGLICDDDFYAIDNFLVELNKTVRLLPNNWECLHLCPGFLWGRLFRDISKIGHLNPEFDISTLPFHHSGRYFHRCTAEIYKEYAMGGPISMLVRKKSIDAITNKYSQYKSSVDCLLPNDVMLTHMLDNKTFICREPQLGYEEECGGSTFDTTHKLDQLFESCGEIEKKIHISWSKKDVIELDLNIIKYGIKQLKELNPDYEFEISDDEDVNKYIKSKIPDEDYQLIKNKHIVEKVDLWRLLKIYYEGGVYVDIDRLVNVPLKNIIKPHHRCLLPMWYDIDFSQDIMISCSKNIIHKLAIKLNLQRRKQSGWTLSQLGSHTYFHAVTQVLCGKSIDRDPHINIVKHLRNIINKCKCMDTYREEPYFNTILYRGPKIHIDKDELYRCYSIKHWLTTGNS